jgi:type IV secretory pathway TraG/TraD family ATPase VirD4
VHHSIVATANIALSPIGTNDNLEKLMLTHTINFDSFRKEKSVIYIKIPEQDLDDYKFLLNIFYHQFFSSVMNKRPDNNELPIFCVLDEFGNMNLPNFNTTITTARKYKVSIFIILQNLNQLIEKYGRVGADIIFDGGIASKLFFSGADLPTTEFLSKLLGDKEVMKTTMSGFSYMGKEPVMKSQDIRTMDDNEALFIMTNKLPLKLKMKPYFNNFILNQYSKIEPFQIKHNIIDKVEYIDLEIGSKNESEEDYEYEE